MDIEEEFKDLSNMIQNLQTSEDDMLMDKTLYKLEKIRKEIIGK